MQARALQAAEHRGAWNRQKVLRFLLAEDCKVDAEEATPASERIVEWDHQRIFTIATTPKGKTTVDVAAQNLSSDRLDAFHRHLEEFIQGPEGFGFIPPKR